jgi:hypothetical protein
MTHQNHAVELTKGPDYLDIWVDTNNNGVRDDDDVNIFVTKGGSVYAESATFKAALDAHLRDRLKEASMALMERFPSADPVAEEQICTLALQMIVKATNEAAEKARELPPLPSAKAVALATMAEQTVHAVEAAAEPLLIAEENPAPGTYAQQAAEPAFTASTPDAWQVVTPQPEAAHVATLDAGYTPPMAQEARDNWWAAAPAEVAATPTEQQAPIAFESPSFAAPEAPAYAVAEGYVPQAESPQEQAAEPFSYHADAVHTTPEEPSWAAAAEPAQTVPLWTPQTTAQAQPHVATQTASPWELQPQEVPRYTPPSNA